MSAMTTTAHGPDRDADAASAPSVPRAPRRTLVVLFGLYLVLLGWVVLWKLEVPWVGVDAMRAVKLVPLLATAEAGASDLPEVVINVVLFVPFGVYLGLHAPSWRWWRVAGAVAAASLGLEVAQYVLAVGSSDVTDVVVNTAGGLAGFGLLARARRRLGAGAVIAMTRVCAAGTVLALLASAAVMASPMRYAPPDGGAGLPGPGPVQREG